MQVALGVLGWQPSEFWLANPATLQAGIAGYKEVNGSSKEEPISRNRYLELKAEDKQRAKHGNIR